MNTTNTQANLVFAEIVQGGLRLGVNLAVAAFVRRDIEFFEKAAADQERLRDLSLDYIRRRIGFDEWLANAQKNDADSFIHQYDTGGEIARLNGLLFTEHARSYYDQFVVPMFDMPEEQLLAAFNIQITSLNDMADLIRNSPLDASDDAYMDNLKKELNAQLDQATPEQLADVLKR